MNEVLRDPVTGFRYVIIDGEVFVKRDDFNLIYLGGVGAINGIGQGNGHSRWQLLEAAEEVKANDVTIS